MINPKKRLKRNKSSESFTKKLFDTEKAQDTTERHLRKTESKLFQALEVIYKLKEKSSDLQKQVESEKKLTVDIKRKMEDQKTENSEPLKTTNKQESELTRSCLTTTSLSLGKDSSSISESMEKISLTQEKSQVEYSKKIAIIEKERDELIKSSQKQDENHKNSITEYEKKLIDVEKALSESINALCNQLSATMEILSKFDQQQKEIDYIESTIKSQNRNPPSITTSSLMQYLKYYVWIFFVFNITQASFFIFCHPNEFIIHPAVYIFHMIANQFHSNE